MIYFQVFGFVKGDEISVDVEKDADSYLWLRTKETGSIMLCHNHPGQSYFSANDVRFFLENDSIGSMSIVTNQGKIWTLSKTERFDFIEAFADIKKRISECNGNYDKAIDGFLKNGYNFGIERS